MDCAQYLRGLEKDQRWKLQLSATTALPAQLKKRLLDCLKDKETHGKTRHWILRHLDHGWQKKLLNGWLQDTPSEELRCYPLPHPEEAEEWVTSKTLPRMVEWILAHDGWGPEWEWLLPPGSPHQWNASLRRLALEPGSPLLDGERLAAWCQASKSGSYPGLREQVKYWLNNHPEDWTRFQQCADADSLLWAQWNHGDNAALVKNIEDPDRFKIFLAQHALVMDIESDGEEIWEIGIFYQGCSRILYGNGSKNSLQEAIEQLNSLSREFEWVVGHNLLTWDLPILERRGFRLKPEKVWDTLLISFLSDPAAPTHALGGRHRADEDARLAFDRFYNQASLVDRESLLGMLRQPGDIYSWLGKQIEPPVPVFLDAPSSSELIFLTPAQAVKVAWRPGFVWWPGAQNSDFRPLDVGQALDRLAAQRSPQAQVISAVLRWARKHGISVCPDMLPSWFDPSLRKFLASLPSAKPPPELPVFTPLPTKVSSRQSPLTIWGCLDRPLWLSSDSRQVPPNEYPKTLTVQAEGNSRWLFDPATQILDPRNAWRSFRVVDVEVLEELAPELPPISTWLADGPMPLPDGADPWMYWIDLLDRLHGWRHDQENAPTLLVLPEEAPKKLAQVIQTALDEVLGTPGSLLHHSRAERLRRCQQHKGVLAVPLCDLTDWLKLAEALSIPLVLAFAALPLHRWGDSLRPNLQAAPSADTEGGEELPGEEEEEDSEPVEVRSSRPSAHEAPLWRQRAAFLRDEHLERWLGRWIPATHSIRRILILDSRLPKVPGIPSQRGQSLPDAARERLADLLAPLRPRQRPKLSTDLAPLRALLKSHWRHEDFYPVQKEILEPIRAHDAHVMAALPTGGGKSVLFQIPALYRGHFTGGLTLVICPLRALMQDQVSALWEKGFEEADYLSSDQPPFEREEVLQRLLDGRLNLLYVAPERFRSQRFCKALEYRRLRDGALEYLVFDEAHCIDQWGYDFRPDYLRALEKTVKAHAKQTPLLFFSATLTAATEKEIRKALGVVGCSRELVKVPARSTSPVQEYIEIHPQKVTGRLGGRSPDWESRLHAIRQVLLDWRPVGERTRSALVVFTRTRRQAEVVCAELTRSTDLRIDYFHAGRGPAIRVSVYERLRDGELDLLVATKAFGMGMDIGHLHGVIHLQPPKFLEDYLQEIGRIGRDQASRKETGLSRLRAILLHSPQDFSAVRERLQQERLDLHALEELWRAIESIAVYTDAADFALIPERGLSGLEFSPDRMRRALYWLEQAGRIQMVETLVDSLPLTLRSARLADLADGDSPEAPLARFLQGQITSQPETAIPAQPPGEVPPAGFLRRLGQALHSFALVVIGRPKTTGAAEGKGPASTERSPQSTQEDITTLLQLREALGHPNLVTHYPKPEDLLRALFELQRAEALVIIRRLTLRKADLAPHEPPDDGDASPEARLEEGLLGLIEALAEDWRSLDSLLELCLSGDPASKTFRAKQHALRRLLPRLGVRRQRRRNAKGRIETWVQLPKRQKKAVRQKARRLVRLATRLFEKAGTSAGSEAEEGIPLQTLLEIELPDRSTPSLHELESALQWLADLEWIQASEPLLGHTHLVALLDCSPWEAGRYESVRQRLDALHHFNEQRIHAMEVFTHLPHASRTAFLAEYLRKADGDTLQRLLEHTLLEVEDTAAWTDELAKLRRIIQGRAIDDLFARYQAPDAPEPAQWRSISFSYDRHLLIEAGPGSGKTAVLLARVVHLIHVQKLQPDQILVLAFNRAVVEEIRRRVKELFEQLGYGAYVRSLRVHTFHAFAVLRLGWSRRHVQQSDFLESFADRLERDAEFRRRTAEGIRVILVDEFQDMNEIRYRILKEIQKASKAAVTLVGDDDQDILGWDRSKKLHGFREGAQFFQHFEEHHAPHIERLTVNFRSAAAIVQASQEFIREQIFDRRKQDVVLRARPQAPQGRVKTLRDRESVLQEAEAWLAEGRYREQTTAILCRTNAEVYEVHQRLRRHCQELRIQGRENLRLVTLRHLAALLDLADKEDPDSPLEEVLPRLREAYAGLPIPETWEEAAGLPSAERVVRLVKETYPNATIDDLRDSLRDQTIDDIERLEAGTVCYAPLVSTIHKVKGLEFDQVFLVPSVENFPLKGNSRPLSEDLSEEAREEARIWYVGMTRARSGLVHAFDLRELAWQRAEAYCKETPSTSLLQRPLSGLHEEVFISWAAFAMNRGQQVQKYIERKVGIGDLVEIDRNKTIKHENTPIGKLQGKHGYWGTGRVCAIVRYFCSPEDPFWCRSSYRYEDLERHVRDQGWHYVVLVETP